MSRKFLTLLDACRAAGPVLLALSFVALPSLAWAAEESHGNPWMDLVWKGINLLVLVGLIAYFARKPVSAALRGMAKESFDKWSAAHQAAQAARADMAEQRRQIEGLAGELSRMVADARADADRESARLVQEARKEADRILGIARQQVEQEVAKARTELHRQIAEDTLRLAEQMIREKATPDQRRKLVESYIREMETPQ